MFAKVYCVVAEATRTELRILTLSLPAAVGLHPGLRRLLSWLRRPRSRIVLKLGDSACTDKAAFETVHTERLQATAIQLAQARSAGGEDRVLLHGAGSFGHFQARQVRPQARRDSPAARALASRSPAPR